MPPPLQKTKPVGYIDGKSQSCNKNKTQRVGYFCCFLWLHEQKRMLEVFAGQQTWDFFVEEVILPITRLPSQSLT